MSGLGPWWFMQEQERLRLEREKKRKAQAEESEPKPKRRWACGCYIDGDAVMRCDTGWCDYEKETKAKSKA